MAPFGLSKLMDKQSQVVFFSATAIALYGYDQGMMSLVNTNRDYLRTMAIAEESPIVGIIVAVYYLGCTIGAILASWLSNARGRKVSIITCLLTASAGNLVMSIAGIGGSDHGREVMLLGRIVMGLGVGGIDAVVPTYSSELSNDSARGTALAQEFQANILGLNLAFAINLAVTNTLGKYSQWAWRTPILVMQVFSLVMLAVVNTLPETPRWYVFHDQPEKAEKAIAKVWGKDAVDERIKPLKDAHQKEQEDSDGGGNSYADMLLPSRPQFHPTVITIMGQVNQALTGYGAVSVYGPQIFELLGFNVRIAEYLTMGNYVFYLAMMTFAWLLIDRKGRRYLLLHGSLHLALSFTLLTILGYLASHSQSPSLHIPTLAPAIPGTVVLYLATAAFGICWLVPPFLIPTEIFPTTLRAQGSAVSVVTWGLANFAVTLLTPIGFNGLGSWLFAVFAVTNAVAGSWSWAFVLESGRRSFEENQEFFEKAGEEGSWSVRKVGGGKWKTLPGGEGEGGKGGQEDEGEREPLLRRSSS